MIGHLEGSGMGSAVITSSYTKSRTSLSSCDAHNRALLGCLREDAHSKRLLELCKCDAEAGPMSWPSSGGSADTSHTMFHPRFAVAQEKPDGSTKVRRYALLFSFRVHVRAHRFAQLPIFRGAAATWGKRQVSTGSRRRPKS